MKNTVVRFDISLNRFVFGIELGSLYEEGDEETITGSFIEIYFAILRIEIQTGRKENQDEERI